MLAIIAILVLLAIVGLGVLKGLGRRKIREAGESKQARIPATLQEFGRSVILGTDTAGAVALIEALPKSRLKSLRPGVWGLNQISKEDAVIEVWPAGSGAEVLVTSLEENFGFPRGSTAGSASPVSWRPLRRRRVSPSSVAHGPSSTSPHPRTLSTARTGCSPRSSRSNVASRSTSPLRRSRTRLRRHARRRR